MRFLRLMVTVVHFLVVLLGILVSKDRAKHCLYFAVNHLISYSAWNKRTKSTYKRRLG